MESGHKRFSLIKISFSSRGKQHPGITVAVPTIVRIDIEVNPPVLIYFV